MVKKLFILFLCAVLSCVHVCADDSGIETNATVSETKISEPRVYTLSLEEAIKLAKTDNPELNVCDIKMESSEVSLDAARDNKRDSKEVLVNVTTGLSIAYVKEGYYIKANESAIRLGELEKKQVESKIAYNVTQKYFNYKLKERLIEIADKAYNLAVENKETVNKMYQLGMVTELEVRNADVMVTQSKIAKENHIRDLEILKEDLKIALQLDGTDCSFVLTDDIDYEDYAPDLEKDLEKAMQNRYDVNALREAAGLSKLYYDITKQYIADQTVAYNNAKSDYMQKEYNYTNGSKQIALSIRNSYNAIISAKSNISVAEMNLAIKKTEYEAAKLKFEMGMITNTELTEKLNNLSQYEVNLENAKLAYKLAVENYKYQISIGL